MQQHVHAADAKHRVVEVEAVEHRVVEVMPKFRVAEDFRVVLTQIFVGRHEETRGSARRVANDVFRLRRGHLDHQPDDVPGRAELPVLPRGRDLAGAIVSTRSGFPKGRASSRPGRDPFLVCRLAILLTRAPSDTRACASAVCPIGDLPDAG